MFFYRAIPAIKFLVGVSFLFMIYRECTFTYTPRDVILWSGGLPSASVAWGVLCSFGLVVTGWLEWKVAMVKSADQVANDDVRSPFRRYFTLLISLTTLPTIYMMHGTSYPFFTLTAVAVLALGGDLFFEFLKDMAILRIKSAAKTA